MAATGDTTKATTRVEAAAVAAMEEMVMTAMAMVGIVASPTLCCENVGYHRLVVDIVSMVCFQATVEAVAEEETTTTTWATMTPRLLTLAQ